MAAQQFEYERNALRKRKLEPLLRARTLTENELKDLNGFFKERRRQKLTARLTWINEEIEKFYREEEEAKAKTEEIDEENIEFSEIDLTPFIQPSYDKKSTEELLENTQSGDKFAAYELGCRYDKENNLDLAYQYFTIATNLGHVYAPLSAALIADKEGRYKDAIPLLEISIERANDPEAHLLLGEYYIYILGKNRNFHNMDKKGFEHFLIAAKLGNSEAQFLAALSYGEGVGTSQCIEEYVFWLRCSQLNGFSKAIQYIYDKMQDEDWKELIWRKRLSEVDERISKHGDYIKEYIRREYYRKKEQNKEDNL